MGRDDGGAFWNVLMWRLVLDGLDCDSPHVAALWTLLQAGTFGSLHKSTHRGDVGQHHNGTCWELFPRGQVCNFSREQSPVPDGQARYAPYKGLRAVKLAPHSVLFLAQNKRSSGRDFVALSEAGARGYYPSVYVEPVLALHRCPDDTNVVPLAVQERLQGQFPEDGVPNHKVDGAGDQGVSAMQY